MKASKLAPFAAALVSVVPFVAFAQGGNLLGLLGLIEQIVSRAIPILVALSLIFFIIGLIRFVIAADEEKRKDGKSMMLWGIIALFVIVSIWGIVSYLGNILDIDQTQTVNPPSVNGI